MRAKVGQGHITYIILNGYPYLDSKKKFKHTTIAADVMRAKVGQDHIALNDYPYLDSKKEFTHTTIAADVMRSM